ncbi:MAG: energy-coupling factor ABC transporter ATP-binding protein [Promethearchaeota archaeon]
MNSSIEVIDISFAYSKDNWIFENVNFTVNPGTITGVIGKSGSGKTTLCYLMKGIIPHTFRGKLYGTVKVDGKNTRKASLVTLSKTIGMVFQEINSQLFGDTVREEVQFGLKNLKMDLTLAESAMEELRLIEIAHKSPQNLSMGQKQRVILASVIAMNPKILILDEPSIHLDSQNRMDLKNWLEKLNKKYNMTILIASNDPWLIGNLCHDIIHIKRESVQKVEKMDVLEVDSSWKWKETMRK